AHPDPPTPTRLPPRWVEVRASSRNATSHRGGRGAAGRCGASQERTVIAQCVPGSVAGVTNAAPINSRSALPLSTPRETLHAPNENVRSPAPARPGVWYVPGRLLRSSLALGRP